MTPLPPITPHNRARALLLGYGLFCLLYLGSYHLSADRAVYLPPSRWDDRVPVWPASIGIYLSQFLLLPWAFWQEQRPARLTRCYYAMLLATLLSCAIFVIWPTTVGQTITSPQPLTAALWQGLYYFDVPGNCWPSLHVALAALAATLLAGCGRYWRWLAPLWAGLIALAVVTTRQHRLVDVAGGLLVAGLAWAVLRRWEVADAAR